MHRCASDHDAVGAHSNRNQCPASWKAGSFRIYPQRAARKCTNGSCYFGTRPFKQRLRSRSEAVAGDDGAGAFKKNTLCPSLAVRPAAASRTNSTACMFRFPADVTVLVQEMEGTLCQTLAAHGGTPSARAVKAGLALLPPELTEVAARVADEYGSPAWVPCIHCSGAPWSPGLVVWPVNVWLRRPRTTLEAHSKGVMPPRGEDLIDWLDVIWVDRAGCRADEGASIEALERRRDARLEEMAFQCEPATS